MMRFNPFLLLALSLLPALPTHSQSPSGAPPRDLAADTWAATDALGRPAPMAGVVRAARKNRFVGIFYFLTHGNTAYYDTSRSKFEYLLYGDDPRVLRDNTRINAASGGDPLTQPDFWKDGGTYWWGQPAAGYFLADDAWVARKNLSMLAAAGVDTLIFDVTNGPQYPKAYECVLDTAEQMRREGSPTPQFLFITHASTGIVANQLYDALYGKGRYENLWFRWEGKPLILGDATGSGPAADPPRPEVRAFFTWRHSWAWDPGQDKWQWMDKYPQKYGWHADPKIPEEMAVVIAGHPTDKLGRSYRSSEIWGQGAEPPLDKRDLAAERVKGVQFSQQWSRALQADPEFIFVTGWNEWTAGLQYGPGTSFLGQATQPGQHFFVDNYNEEFSRDAMPMQGGYGDDYYMQLVDGIRRFKGVRPAPVAHGFYRLTVQTSFAAWKAISPEYLDAAGDTQHRDWPGWGGLHYTDQSGRNDIVAAKAACDAKNVYFYVRTRAKLTPWAGPNWMQLLIDADQNPKTGWNGYDFLVNGHVLSAARTTLKRLRDGKMWPVAYRQSGNEMQVTVPRALLGLTSLTRTRFDFHWVDNAPVGGDPARIADWWYVGDSAPDGRFNYRYTDLR